MILIRFFRSWISGLPFPRLKMINHRNRLHVAIFIYAASVVWNDFIGSGWQPSSEAWWKFVLTILLAWIMFELQLASARELTRRNCNRFPVYFP